MEKVEKTEQEWREKLTPEEYRILRDKGTEAPFSGEYDHVFEPGTYRCAGCGAELFDSDAKYDSGCGWPAFSAPAGEEAVAEDPILLGRQLLAPLLLGLLDPFHEISLV